MPKFRKKPVEIEAVQWTDGNGFHLVDWITSHGAQAQLDRDADPSIITIDTREGVMTAQHDDWIIRGVRGEFYPCKPDIFKATYDAASALVTIDWTR